MTITYSMLHFHWFLLTFTGIVLIEAIVYYKYWRQPLVALSLSFVANIGSTLITFPFLIGTIGQKGYSLFSWLNLIIISEELVKNPTMIFSDIWFYFPVLFLFFIAFLITLPIEVFLIRILKEKEPNDLKVSTIANLITYTIILILLILLGGLFSFVNQNPEIKAESFYGSWLFVELDEFLLFGGLFGFFIYLGIILMLIILLTTFYIEVSKKYQSKLPLE